MDDPCLLRADYGDSMGGEAGFNDHSLGGSLSYVLSDVWGANASLTYIGQLDDAVLVDVDAGGSYDVDVVGMLGLSASF
ncbi:MAG: hypothetical protein JXR25_00415 [Pontiellaceae bacterium]|nr:hypothetical protein [Pontiellaceae bacterium]MBN2783260.1 hypothetical protein [Pontiellaceae bacterium]